MLPKEIKDLKGLVICQVDTTTKYEILRVDPDSTRPESKCPNCILQISNLNGTGSMPITLSELRKSYKILR